MYVLLTYFPGQWRGAENSAVWMGAVEAEGERGRRSAQRGVRAATNLGWINLLRFPERKAPKRRVGGELRWRVKAGQGRACRRLIGLGG